MALSTICMIIWFALYGISFFLKEPIQFLGFAMAVLAIVISVALIAKN